jgi:hypothetical protein
LGSCSKSQCVSSPKGEVTTTVKPCSTKTTAPTATPTLCPPSPTNICVDKGSPICGIPLPIVNCNDNKNDWAVNPFKLYDDEDSKKCSSFPIQKLPDACSSACKQQYDQCVKFDFWNCSDLGKRGISAPVVHSFEDRSVDRRTLGMVQAVKCKIQYDACLLANKKLNPVDKCKSWAC